MVASLALTMVLDPKMMRFPLPAGLYQCIGALVQCTTYAASQTAQIVVETSVSCSALHDTAFCWSGGKFAFCQSGGKFALEKSALVKQRPPPLLREKQTL